MTDHHGSFDSSTIQPIWLSVPKKYVLLLVAGVVMGIFAAWLGSTVYSAGWRRLQLAYLVAFSFVLSLSLGSLFIVLIQHLTRAGWSVIIRRPAEIFSLNIITVAVLALPIAWWVQRGELYPWAQIGLEEVSGQQHHSHHSEHQQKPQPELAQENNRNGVIAPVAFGHVSSPPLVETGTHPSISAPLHFSEERMEVRASDTTRSAVPRSKEEILADLYVHQKLDDLTLSKQPWLNRGSFLFRMVMYFGVWAAIAGFYYQQSRRQDLVADRFAATRRMEWVAGFAVIAFGLSLTFAAFDWLMSLDPHWYSTMFGVYYFAGCAIGGFAVNLLVILLANRWGLMIGLISVEHRRDLGRFLFAFVFFWAYIAFSQYMLLWYANVPETTRWFAVRGASLATGYANSWGWLLIILLFGHFVIPFLGIMSRHVKANPQAMVFWTIWLMIMHYLDLYWLIMPELGPNLTFGLMELGTLIGVACLWLLGASLIATQTSLVPVGDPRLSESLRAVEMY